MPNTLFTVSNKKNWKLERPILAEDWLRPLVYAPRVKTLTLGNQGSSPLVTILPLLSACAPQGCLFPQLEQLSWNNWMLELIHMGMLISPKLSGLAILCDATATNVSYLTTLAYRCPELRSLSISHSQSLGRYFSESYQTISAVACELKNLESLTTSVIHFTSLPHLARQRNFRVLRVHCIQPVDVGLTATTLHFPHLEEVAVAAIEFEVAARFLAMCREAPLASLQMTFRSNFSQQARSAFDNALATLCSPSSLNSLRLSSPDPLSAQSLLVLQRFTNMVYMSLRASSFDIEDAHLETLAKHCPHLEVLEMRTPFKIDRVALPTLRCLSFFAHYCPHLQLVHMTLDATYVPLCVTRTVQRKLTAMNVEYSNISHSPGVARYLSGFFPNLAFIESEHGTEQHEYRIWNEVEVQLPEFVMAREEERFFGRR
ncbi:hypothetical protein DFH06DRAFT_1213604 [Mycena polygramma]|nr:hypothetical protein DFH06DRAFT_1213604 [Mycena polygramma]